MKNLNLLNLLDNSICNFLFSLVAIIVYTISCYLLLALVGVTTWLMHRNPPRQANVNGKYNIANTRWDALYNSLLDSQVKQPVSG
ncbi:MAG: hypothetical protein AAFZ15_33875 [Bacteroidota bacterium]